MLFADRLSRFYSRLRHRLGDGVWARLLVAEPENTRLTVRTGAVTAAGGLGLIVIALLRGP
jgi:hypothetical protein